MSKSKKIEVQGVDILFYQNDNDDFISLTDIARHKDSNHTDSIIQNWMRNRNTIELLGFWETIYNTSFKPLEFEGFRKQAGLNSFVMTPKRWIESTNAIGIVSKAGRYGGTEADLLNVALFGVTAKEWREASSNLKGTTKSSTKLNMRDDATIEQLVV